MLEFSHFYKDRYRDLIRLSCQWMDIESRLRAGEAHEPERTSIPGSLALHCVTCPRPGFNLPEAWEQGPDQ